MTVNETREDCNYQWLWTRLEKTATTTVNKTGEDGNYHWLWTRLEKIATTNDWTRLEKIATTNDCERDLENIVTANDWTRPEKIATTTDCEQDQRRLQLPLTVNKTREDSNYQWLWTIPVKMYCPARQCANTPRHLTLHHRWSTTKFPKPYGPKYKAPISPSIVRLWAPAQDFPPFVWARVYGGGKRVLSVPANV